MQEIVDLIGSKLNSTFFHRSVKTCCSFKNIVGNPSLILVNDGLTGMVKRSWRRMCSVCGDTVECRTSFSMRNHERQCVDPDADTFHAVVDADACARSAGQLGEPVPRGDEHLEI